MELNTNRTKKKKTADEEIIKRAKHVFDNFKEFTSGTRVILLLQRHKEGGETNNTRLHKIVTRNEKEFLAGLTEMEKRMAESDQTLRIYSSLNQRDFEKAIRQFKSEQLDADYSQGEQKQNFYLDAKNRFIGALMQPQQRSENNFLFDVDNVDGKDIVGTMLQTIPNEHIIKQYKTKNGWHIITKPFNYTIYDYPECVGFKKDGLLLLDY